MAGPGFSPVGSMSATRVDFGPLMERLRMQLANNQFGQQMQQQQQFHGDDMNLANLRLNAQESQFTRGLGEQVAGREQQGELARAGQAFNERELAQQGELTRAGQGLQRRGQDIGVEQAGLDRAQQGAQFERGAGQRDMELEQGAQRIRQQGEQFDKDLAQRGAEMDFRKDVAYKQLANEDKKLAIDERMADLDAQFKQGQIGQQQYEGERLRIGVEAAGMALAEAKADIGLSPAQWNVVMDYFDRGERPPGEILSALQKSPKAAAALEYFYKALDTAQGRIQKQQITDAEVESTEARTGLAKAQTEAQITETELVKAKTKPMLGRSGEFGQAETAAQRDLDRKKADGSLGEVGELRQLAYEKLAEVQGDDSEPAANRRKKLQRLLDLTKGMNDEDDIPGSLSPDKTDAILGASIIGIPALLGRSGYRIVDRLRQESGMGEEGELRDLADEFGIEP